MGYGWESHLAYKWESHLGCEWESHPGYEWESHLQVYKDKNSLLINEGLGYSSLGMVAVHLDTSEPKIDKYQNDWVISVVCMYGNYMLWLCSWLPE